MHWVTTRGVKINRAATAWLIRRFIDPQAIFVFVGRDDVAATAQSLGGVGFHAPSAAYPARDPSGRTPFEALVAERCSGDDVLVEMSVLVRHADVPQAGEVPEAAGLRLISSAFPLVASDDHETIERSAFLYDALYAGLAARRARQAPPRSGP
jgi:hypothetical protein